MEKFARNYVLISKILQKILGMVYTFLSKSVILDHGQYTNTKGSNWGKNKKPSSFKA